MDNEPNEQDRWLPIANVARIMKNTLPSTAKVSKDAKECMQECVSEFISFITSEASDRCITDKRKTINGEDILYALNVLGFENYSEVLKIYLAKYREQQAMNLPKEPKKYIRKAERLRMEAEAQAEAEAGVQGHADEFDYLPEGLADIFKKEVKKEDDVLLDLDVEGTLRAAESLRTDETDEFINDVYNYDMIQ